MTRTPNLDMARDLLSVALTVTEDDPPPPDWLDDRDVAVAFIVNTVMGLAELLATRDDLGDGLMSGRYRLVVSSAGVALMTTDAAGVD